MIILVMYILLCWIIVLLYIYVVYDISDMCMIFNKKKLNAIHCGWAFLYDVYNSYSENLLLQNKKDVYRKRRLIYANYSCILTFHRSVTWIGVSIFIHQDWSVNTYSSGLLCQYLFTRIGQSILVHQDWSVNTYSSGLVSQYLFIRIGPVNTCSPAVISINQPPLPIYIFLVL